MNSDRIPNRWRKQLTRLFLTSQYNWQDLALSTPAASVLKGSAVLLLSQHWGSDNRQVWGNECYWEESRGGKPGSGRTKVIREIINTCIVFFCLFLSLILIPSLWEYIIVVCVCVCVCECVCAQSCLTLCNPMDYSLPGSSVHGILQARMLEWVAISFVRVSSQPSNWTLVSCVGRQILYHWATWEVLPLKILYTYLYICIF